MARLPQSFHYLWRDLAPKWKARQLAGLAGRAKAGPVKVAGWAVGMISWDTMVADFWVRWWNVLHHIEGPCWGWAEKGQRNAGLDWLSDLPLGLFNLKWIQLTAKLMGEEAIAMGTTFLWYLQILTNLDWNEYCQCSLLFGIYAKHQWLQWIF